MSSSASSDSAARTPYQPPRLKRYGAAADLTAFNLKSGDRDGDMGGTKRTQ